MNYQLILSALLMLLALSVTSIEGARKKRNKVSSVEEYCKKCPRSKCDQWKSTHDEAYEYHLGQEAKLIVEGIKLGFKEFCPVAVPYLAKPRNNRKSSRRGTKNNRKKNVRRGGKRVARKKGLKKNPRRAYNDEIESV